MAPEISIGREWNVNNVKRSEIDKVMEKRQACLRPSSPSGGIDTTSTATGSTIFAPNEGSTFSAVIGRHTFDLLCSIESSGILFDSSYANCRIQLYNDSVSTSTLLASIQFSR